MSHWTFDSCVSLVEWSGLGRRFARASTTMRYTAVNNHAGESLDVELAARGSKAAAGSSERQELVSFPDKVQKSNTGVKIATLVGSVFVGAMMIVTIAYTLAQASTPQSFERATTKDSLGFAEFDDMGRIILTDYDTGKPFSSFLPGIGGEYGIPMWAFYVSGLS